MEVIAGFCGVQLALGSLIGHMRQDIHHPPLAGGSPKKPVEVEQLQVGSLNPR